MADTVDTITLADGPRNHVVRLTNESDGTGESAVTKIDKSTLTGPLTGQEPGSLSLLEASWSVKGGYVVLEWDHTANDEILVMSGDGNISYDAYGGLGDPKSSGGTGDVVLTTDSFFDGDGYSITLHFKKKS